MSILTDLEVAAYNLTPVAFDGSGVRLERMKQWEGPDTWAIRSGYFCMNRAGEWEYEPLPSNRTDEFLERCRFGNPQRAYLVWNKSPHKTPYGKTQS